MTDDDKQDDSKQYRYVLEWLGGAGEVIEAPFASDARPAIRPSVVDERLIEVYVPDATTPQPTAVLPIDRFVILRRELIG